MLNKIIFILLFCTSAAAQNSYHIELTSNFPADFQINDSLVSKSILLIEGEYIISATLKSDSSFGSRMAKQVNIVSDTLIAFNFPYRYIFTSQPFNVGVYYKDSLLGYTPLRAAHQNKLTERIFFRKFGYKEQSFIPYDSAVSRYYITLQPVNSEFKDQIVQSNRTSQFRTQRNIPLISLFSAAMLSSGYLAYDFKTKANDAYDEYLKTASQIKYNDANKFDTYSLISLITMQAALGGLIYFLFFD